MNKRLQKLLGQRSETVAAMRAMLDLSSTESRDLTADEAIAYAAHEATLATVNASITREQSLADAERTVATAVPGVAVGHNRESDRPFASLGEQLLAIADVGMGKPADPRLFAAASGASATSGPDGGFLIAKDFATDLTSTGYQTGVLSSRCSTTEIGENSDGLEVVTIDETSRADGSRWGGVQVFRRKEADTVTATKPKLGKWESRLEDMMGLAYVTDRQMMDGAALGAVFDEAFGEEFGYKADAEIWSGNGVGECLGVTQSDAFVSVPKVAGQTAATVVAQNVIDMWARVPLRNRLSGVWVYNQELEPQLTTMTIGAGAGIVPVFLPPGGLSGSQYSTIYGRPALPIEQAEVAGTPGDIAFLDLNQYKLIRKGGTQKDESIHVRFIYGERAFRWVTRFNGAPKWKTARTPAKGANKVSPFVGIAVRS